MVAEPCVLLHMARRFTLMDAVTARQEPWKWIYEMQSKFSDGFLVYHLKKVQYNGKFFSVILCVFLCRKIMFVLQIGCHDQTATCNIVSAKNGSYSGILLQYTDNKVLT